MASPKVIEAKSTQVPTKPNAEVTKTSEAKTASFNPPNPRLKYAPSYSGSTTPATDTIVIASMVMIGTSLVKDVAHGQPSIRPVVTGMLLGGILLIVGTFAPTLAKMLAIFGMIGSLMTNGLELTQVAGKLQ